MRTADYIDILNGTAHFCGIAEDEASATEFGILRTIHSDRLKTIWEHHYWPFLLPPPEQRYFRLLWSSATSYLQSTLTSPAEVFFPGPNKYYQSLVAHSNQAPATLVGNTWETNEDYWAESNRSETADAYSATTAYEQGDKAFYPNTNRVYVLFAASSTGNAPTDTTKWCVLTDFEAYVEFEQTGETAFEHATEAWDRNPNIDGRAIPVACWQSDVGLQVLDNVPWIFLEFRIRCPVLTGAAYDATATYAIGDQVYYDTGVRGNFYDIILATSAGETPVSAPTKFELVEIPLAFRKYLIHGGAADWLRTETDQDKGDREFAMGESELDKQVGIHFAQAPHRSRVTQTVR